MPENLARPEIDQTGRDPDIDRNTLSAVNLFEVLDCTGDNALGRCMAIEETDGLKHSGRLQIVDHCHGGGPARVDGPTVVGVKSKPLS